MNRAVARGLVDRLMTLAGDAPMPQVRAVATSRLRRIAARLKAVVAPTDAQAAHGQLVQTDIARFLARPYPQAKPDSGDGAAGRANRGGVGIGGRGWCATPAAGASAPFFPPLVSAARRGRPWRPPGRP